MTNDKCQKVFDLEERTANYGVAIIKFCRNLPKSEITKNVIDQLVRSATSIGANYCEADCAESRKDFMHKLGICNKEAKETKHWLHMSAIAVPERADEARILWKEGHELNLIFVAIIKKTKNRQIEH